MSMIPSRLAPFVLVGLGASIALNAVWFFGARGAAPEAPAQTEVATEAPTPEPPALLALDALPADLEIATGEAPQAAEPALDAPAPAPAAPAAELAPGRTAPAAPPAVAAAGARVARAAIVGSIPQSLAEPAAPLGDAVSAATSRLFMWDLDLRRDLRAGDPLAVAYEVSDAGEVTILGAKLGSGRLGETLTAYRYQAAGDRFPSYWTADGVEVERRLEHSPIRDYEQTTSLLRDRPNHHGMDFKTPTGTEVVAPFDGVVTRSNWNWSANGNCIEIELADGTLAKFLHLSDNRVRPGERVRAGQLVALSGNTGRSSGPHLHYQLNRGSQVVDPIDYHGTTRRTLPEADRAAFAEAVARIDALLLPDGWVASN